MQENDNNIMAETLVNYNMLIELLPALEDVVDTGMVTVDAQERCSRNYHLSDRKN